MSYTEISGTNTQIRMWADPSEVEQAAMQQLTNVTTLPWIHGLAVMPDVHYGKGATVGSVIAMRGAVCPAAVGVDIGCLDAETEFLSPQGWVKISDWNGQQVMSYDPETDTAHFSDPTEYINLPCDEFFHFKNGKGMDQMLSEEHRVLVFQGYKSKGYAYSVMRPDELASKPLGNGYYATKASFHVSMPDLDVSDAMIRVEVMIQADGRVRRTSLGNRVEMHLRRERKITRAQELLKNADIDHTVTVESGGSNRIAFTMPFDYGTKDLSRYWLASERQLSIITEEVLLWDGHVGYRSNYSTTDACARDLIQYAFAATGVRAGWSNVGKQADHHNDVFMVTPTKNPMVGYCDPVIVPSVDGRKYCFVVDTGFFVARRNGKIFTTGNCGMSAVKTSLTAEDLPDDLSRLRSRIEESIPVGFQMHDDLVDPSFLGDVDATAWSILWNTFSDLVPHVHGRNDRAERQLGTLGGGNHFVEVCLDTAGAVWLMLHSGSRNIGKELAEFHIGVAQRLSHNQGLVDKDLSVFLADTPQMAAYRHDLYWAQEYARLNRTLMMAILKRIIADEFSRATPAFEDEISAHHNYVAEEMYDGLDLLVTRKGAIRARKGEYGIIPGSMGTGSYIVRGLGNEKSFNSASHGAGRKMSRNQARRKFTEADLKAQTFGVECRKDSGVVDEIPAAYKSIDDVIQRQGDLVEVVAKLKQVICVKG